MKKLIVFDLDGTLAVSKSPLDPEMATLLGSLLEITKIAVISGTDWSQFETQLLAHLSHSNCLNNFLLLPTCGIKFYQYDIDITTPGIDKAYGIRKLRDTLGISIDEMIFIGDALFPGGNDYPAKEAGVVSIQVRDPVETKRVIETIIACLGSAEPNDQ
jgi:hydroxymethylpyrimidine pyrophosphatase-like HAD family hydrolase